MAEWIENGCRLGWLVHPFDPLVTIYRADGSKSTPPFEKTLSGKDVLPGFTFDTRTLP